MSNNNKKFATGWLIVVACMLIQAIPFGVASNIQPQFVSYVVQEHGFTLAGFSLIFTLGTVVSAIASPIIGMLFNKINTKIMFLAGCILSGGGFLAFSMCTELWQFYLVAGIVQVGTAAISSIGVTKIMFLAGCILSGGGFLAFSMCTELWQFYLVAGIVQVGTAAISSIGVPLLINGWFDELSKGKAMGLAFAGGSIGNIFLQSLVASSLAANGSSKSYLIFGALSLAVGIPITLLFLRMPKNDSEIVKGTKKEENKENTSKETTTVDWGYTFNEAKNLKFFWLFGLGLFFLGMYVSALAVQYPAYLKVHLAIDHSIVGYVGSIFALFSLGGNLFGGIIFDKVSALAVQYPAYLKVHLAIDHSIVGYVGSIFALFSLGGNLFGGIIFDKLGVTKGLMVASVLAFVSCVALMSSGHIPQLAFVFAALKGLSVFAYMMGPSILTGSFFGQKDFGTILGTVQIFFAVGFAAGSAVFGFLVDKFSYEMAWSVILVFIVICYASLIFASIGMNKLNKERKAKLEKEVA